MLYAALLSRYPNQRVMLIKAWVNSKVTPDQFRELPKLKPKDTHLVSPPALQGTRYKELVENERTDNAMITETEAKRSYDDD